MSERERLTSRILHPCNASPSTEDIFSSALETLFTDNTQQSHGIPGQSIIYRSPRFGDVYLRVPAHPGDDESRQLFAHYLWNAGVIAAEAIEKASCDEESQTPNGEDVKWDKQFWDMRGRDVLELGAATALPSLISILSNARTVVATDHPSSPAITTDAITSSIKANVTNRGSPVAVVTTADPSTSREYDDNETLKLNHPSVVTNSEVSVCGYAWGTGTFYSSEVFGQPVSPQPEPNSFDRIIVADCLWMSSQHVNLVKTVLSYLRNVVPDDGREQDTVTTVPCALIVAGFHTGRNVVKDFIQIATGSITGNCEVRLCNLDAIGDEPDIRGQLKASEIFEINIDGRRRAWEPDRPNETQEQSKQWCMCAVLIKKQ